MKFSRVAIFFFVCFLAGIYFYQKYSDSGSLEKFVDSVDPEMFVGQRDEEREKKAVNRSNIVGGGELRSQPVGARKLSVEDLIDVEDRTEINRLYIDNHNALVAALRKIDEAENAGRDIDFQLQVLVKMLQAVVNDIYFTNEVYHGRIPLDRVTDVGVLDLSRLPVTSSLHERIPVYYLDKIINLSVRLKNATPGKITQGEVKIMLREVKRLVLKRKEQSDVFFLTYMKKYYPSNKYSIEEKIRFARSFIDSGDRKLVKYSIKPFRKMLSMDNYASSKEMIELLLDDIRQMFPS